MSPPCAKWGFNRASIGVQDFNPNGASGRASDSTARSKPRSHRMGARAGFSSINLDLIYGLPYQTVESFDKTLDEIIKLGRIAWRCSVMRTSRG
jgi:oxygen-independent coproporphyrinogen III oxidase